MSHRKRYGLSPKRVKRLRFEIFLEQGGRCHWCKDVMTIGEGGEVPPRPTDVTLDHVKPIADGGARKKRANLVAACVKCNSMRPANKHYRDVAKQQTAAAARRGEPKEPAP